MHLKRVFTRPSKVVAMTGALFAAIASGCRCEPMRILHTREAVVMHANATCDHYRGASADVLVKVPRGVRLEVWDIEYPKDCQCFEVEYAGQRGWVMYNRGRFERE
jgi:hypothetical protein